MSILSKQTIRRLNIITPCREESRDSSGRSIGLSCCGYDITLNMKAMKLPALFLYPSGFALAAACEHFNIPNNVVGIVHDKSSLARKGLAVQNTVLEPGWHGYVTLELSNHSKDAISLPHGAAVAQVLFHFLDEETEAPYAGRYQGQGPEPQESR